MTARFNYSMQDDVDLYNVEGVPEEVRAKAELWSNFPDTVPTSKENDDGERRLRDNGADAVLGHAEQYRPDEMMRAAARAEVMLDRNFPERIAAQTRTDMMGKAINIREAREALMVDYRSKAERFRRIKTYHGLAREPRYASSATSTFAIAAGFFIAEAAVNGIVLGDVVPNGWIGGWGLAAVIGGCNVATGAIAGLFLPKLWATRRKSWVQRAIAGIGGGLAIGIVLVLNFAVAFVRTHGIEDLSTSLAGFWQGNLLPTNLESLGLLGLGVIIALATYLKFAALRDPIAEYEAAHREAVNLEVQIADLDESVPAQLHECARAGTTALAEAFGESCGRVIGFRKSLIESRGGEEKLHSARRRILVVHERCMERRRGDLRFASRKTPLYWSQSVARIDDDFPSPFDLVAHERLLLEMEKTLEDQRTELATADREIEDDLRRARSNLELGPMDTNAKLHSTESNVVQMTFKRDSVNW